MELHSKSKELLKVLANDNTIARLYYLLQQDERIKIKSVEDLDHVIKTLDSITSELRSVKSALETIERILNG